MIGAVAPMELVLSPGAVSVVAGQPAIVMVHVLSNQDSDYTFVVSIEVRVNGVPYLAMNDPLPLGARKSTTVSWVLEIPAGVTGPGTAVARLRTTDGSITIDQTPTLNFDVTSGQPEITQISETLVWGWSYVGFLGNDRPIKPAFVAILDKISVVWEWDNNLQRWAYAWNPTAPDWANDLKILKYRKVYAIDSQTECIWTYPVSA